MSNQFDAVLASLLSPEGKASMLHATKAPRTNRYALVKGGINIVHSEKVAEGYSNRKTRAVRGSLLGEYGAKLVSAQERFDTRSEDGNAEVVITWELISRAGETLETPIRAIERIWLDEQGDSFILDAIEESIASRYPETVAYGLEQKLRFLVNNEISIFCHPAMTEAQRLYTKFYHSVDSFAYGYQKILEAQAELQGRKKIDVPIPDFDNLGAEEQEKDFERFTSFEEDEAD